MGPTPMLLGVIKGDSLTAQELLADLAGRHDAPTSSTSSRAFGIGGSAFAVGCRVATPSGHAPVRVRSSVQVVVAEIPPESVVAVATQQDVVAPNPKSRALPPNPQMIATARWSGDGGRSCSLALPDRLAFRRVKRTVPIEFVLGQFRTQASEQ